MIMSLVIATGLIAGIIGWCFGVMSVVSLKRKYLKKVPLSQIKSMYTDAYVAGRLNAEQIAALFELLD